MTDKKNSDPKAVESTKSSTTPKAGSTIEQGVSASLKVSTDSPKGSDNPKASTTKTTTDKKTTTTRSVPSTSATNASFSKLALFALIIALLSASGVGALYWFQLEQNKISTQDIQQQIANISARTAAKIQTASEQLNTQLITITNQAASQISQQNQEQVTQLQQQIARLQQNQPSDWLIHEAEYLIRIASRTIWLEKDTRAAINLLKDADARIKELNDPQFLPIRQKIREDIEALQLMPALETEDAILSLMALAKQVNSLPLAMVEIPDATEESENLALSENVADWRENIAKTWQRFLADFITVRRREGNVEPLMAPEYQQNLRENLKLKLQVTQWAASKQLDASYQQNLAEAQQWLNEYYDMSQVASEQFQQALIALKSKVIQFDYPSKLSSLSAIQALLAEKPLAPLHEEPSTENHKSEQVDSPTSEAI